MNDPGGSLVDPATEFVKELAKRFPIRAVYDDVASPAARQTGQLALDIVKTLHLALFPIQFLAASQDRLRNFIDGSIRKVPEEKRVSPPPQILGPIIEGIRYEPEGTPIDQMFSELLACSIDAERMNDAHPAFPTIIRQLSSDEARILNYLNQGVDELPRDGLQNSDYVSLYMEHLDQLGLVFVLRRTFHEIGSQPAEEVSDGSQILKEYGLTPWGRRFVQACTGKKH